MMSFFAAVFVLVLASFGAQNGVECTHLVTMVKEELMEIIACVSNAKNPVLCEKLIACEAMMPQQVKIAYEKCQKECMVQPMARCSAVGPMFPTPETPAKIFDCIVLNTHKLNPEENKLMVDFEECSRALFIESCQPPKISI